MMDMPFVPFSTAHWLGITMTIALISCIIGFRRELRLMPHPVAGRWGLVVLLVGSECALYTWYTLTDNWGLHALPFQLCSLTLWLSVLVLLTRSWLLYEVTFFLGILGATQALLTPNLDVTFPHFRYFHFFLAHAGIIGASVYMTAVERFRPQGASMLKAFLALHLLAVPAAVTNLLTGSNFMFLARKPETASLLDWLAPWPWYLVQLEGVVVALFLLQYAIIHKLDRLWKKRYRIQRRKAN